MRILNLGCGAKTAPHPEVVNIDWSLYLRVRQNPVLRKAASSVLSTDRAAKLQALPENLLVYDLTKGLPFEDDTVDVVYASHVLEHLDRNAVTGFLAEIRRVLREGGVVRLVVPDFEVLCRKYLKHIEVCLDNPARASEHECYVAAVLEQSVRREAYSTSRQPPLTRLVENAILGDARRRGETHQWMYDRISLPYILSRAGFADAQVETFNSSRVPLWSRYGLDIDEQGNEYKPHSLYVEAVK